MATARGLRPGGLLRELLRLVVLVGLGFGAGLLFGVVTEEPELLAGHLRGESESVELADVSAAGPSAPVVEAGALDSSAGRPTPEDAPSRSSALPREGSASSGEVSASTHALSATADDVLARMDRQPPGLDSEATAGRPEALRVAAERPRAPAAPGRSDWAIQVGAFADEVTAVRLADSLRGDYPVAVVRSEGSGKRWRVRVQPIRGEAQAREVAARLKREERLPTWVTRLRVR